MNSFEKLVDTAIAINRANRLRTAIVKDYCDYITYILEFSTIQISIGRASGKSHYIATRATSEDLIIRPRLVSRNNDLATSATIINPDNIDLFFRGYRNPKFFSTLYVDEPDISLRHTSLPQVLKCLQQSNIKIDTVVMFGTPNYG